MQCQRVCEDKRISRLAEEVTAKRFDALADLSEDDLRKVLGELEAKRKRDADYLRGATKRAKLQQPPVARDISGSTVYFEPTLHMTAEDVDTVCTARSLTASSLQDPCSKLKPCKLQCSSEQPAVFFNYMFNIV